MITLPAKKIIITDQLSKPTKLQCENVDKNLTRIYSATNNSVLNLEKKEMRAEKAFKSIFFSRYEYSLPRTAVSKLIYV